jgi:hypothetical protein
MRIRIRAVLTIVLTLGVSVSAAQVNLKDLARRNGGRAVLMADPNLPLTTMPDLVSQSDTIVHARIVRAVSKLTPDETRVVTEYELAPLRFFRQRAPAKSRVPTGPVPLMMRLPAGRVYVDGLELGVDNSAFPEPWLREGDECLVFLKYESEIAEYIPYGGPFGIFRVINGRVSALREFVAGKRHDTEKDLGSFASELQRLLTAK